MAYLNYNYILLRSTKKIQIGIYCTYILLAEQDGSHIRALSNFVDIAGYQDNRHGF